MAQFRRQTSYQYLDFNSKSLSASASATNGAPFTINFNEWAQFARFDWSKVRLEKRFVVPKGVSLASPINMYWNGVTNAGSVGFTTQVKSGVSYDTISVFTTRMRGANNSDDNFSIDFVNDCSLNTDTCSEIVIGVSSFVHIDDGDVTMPCYTSPIGCGSVSIIKDCNAKHKGFNILSQTLERATFGWTDSSRTTRVTSNTPGVILNKAHPFDSIKLTAVISTLDTALNNLYFDVTYTHLPGTSDPIAYLSNVSKATITDVSSSSTFSFNNLSVSKTNTSSTEHTLRLNLSELRDSMRNATGNNSYLFGGDVGSSVYTNDTIKIEFYIYGNRLEDNNITTQLLAFSNPSTKSSIPLCIYRGSEISLQHEDERVSRRTDNYGWRSCSSPFYSIVGFSYLDAGSTSNPSSPISPLFDPVEFKPYTEFDSVYLTWDESVYFLDTNEPYYYTRYYYGGINFGAVNNTLPLSKSLVKIISTNEVMVYTSSLAKRYALGARDHLQVALPFRNACGRDLSSSSTVHSGGNQRFNFTLYRNLYPQAIGGPRTSNATTSFTSVTTTADLPELQLNVTTPAINASTDTVQWTFSARNTHLSEMTPYTWVDIQSPSGGINPISLTDGTKSYPLLPYANGYWAKIDTILANSAKNLTLFADFTTCVNDSLQIKIGYSCSQYPVDPAQGYPSTGYVCNDIIKEDKLKLLAKKPLIQNLIVSEPDSAVELCDTLDYVLFSQNSGEVDVKNFRQQLILPVSTLSIIPSTSEMEWPVGSGTWVSINDPNLFAGIYEWDFSSEFVSGVLPGAGIPLDSNKFNIRFKLKTGCPFTSGDQLVFKVIASELCGSPISSIPVAGKPITIQGLPPSPSTVLTIDFEEDTLNACTNNTSGSVFITNAVGGPTSGQEKLIFQIDDTTLNLSNPIFNTINASYLVSTVPSDTIINNKRVLEWSLVSNVPVGDSIGFDFNLISLNHKISSCSRVPIKISTAEKHQILCNSTSVLCDINFPIATTFDTLTVRKGELFILRSKAISNSCVDSVKLSFTIANNGVKIPANRTKVTFASDDNLNGILDTGDSYFTGQEYLISDSLDFGDSINIVHSLYLDMDACNIFLILDTSNCACSTTDTLISIEYDENIDSLVLCSGETDSLPVCSSSKHVLTRSYQWTSLSPGSLTSYLSSTSVIKPIFSSPTVTTQSTYAYRLETIRGNCSNFDTVIIVVNPLPTTFTTTDAIACSTFAIQPDSIETGVSYSVWDRITGGANLGITPFNITITQDTFYYIQATNTLSGCELQPRTIIRLYNDTINPVVSCMDTTIYLDATGNFVIDTSFVLSSATDNCGIDSVYLSNSNFSCANVGNNPITIYVRDVNGNIDSCNSVVTVEDTINPVVSCVDTTIYLDATGNFAIDTSFVLSSATDNCGIDSVYLSNSNFNCANVGNNSVTIYVRDVNGNIDSCNSVVTVVDTINPVISCTDTTIYLNNSGFISIDSSFVISSLFDVCGIDSVHLTNTDFTCTDTGINVITINVWDFSGNQTSCSALVTVRDTANPIVSCKDTLLELSSSGNLTISSNMIMDSVFDVCGIDTVYISKTTFSCSDIGVNQVTLFVIDNNGNLDSCQANVTVRDNTNPIVNCLDTTIQLSNLGIVSIDTSFILSLATDNCGIDSVYLSNSNFNCTNVGNNSVTIYVRDVNGNIDSCSSVVTVVDTTNPVVSCMDTTIYLDATGNFAIDTSFVLSSATDNCGIDSVYLSNSNFNCTNVGNNPITIYVRDVNGNIDSCNSVVTVEDTINPIVSCTDTTIYLDATGNFAIDTSFVLSSTSDNCGIDSVYLSNSNFNCANVGNNSVTIYVRDVNGNIDSCNSVVTVVDTINPIISCNNATLYLNNLGTVSLDTAQVLTSITSNCSIDSVYLSKNSFLCNDIGINSVAIYARDRNGNIDSCITLVTVLDTVPPSVVCRDTVIYLSTLGAVSLDSSYVLSSFNDNCQVQRVTLSKKDFSCIDTGVYVITVVAYDQSGNVDSCQSRVSIIDTISPTAICQNVNVFLDSTGQGNITTADVNNGSFDNCSIQLLTLDKASFDCSDIGINLITLTVTDQAGNSSTCTSNVTVIDNVAPIVNCPPVIIDTTLLNDCRFTVPDYSLNISAFDNCTSTDSITFIQSPLPGTVIDYSTERNDVNTLNINITAFDGELNSTSCSFDLMIGCRVNASVPQIFSPNGDGLNDVLYAFGRNFTSFEFVIYNRWGEKVFETNDPTIGWDGNFKGKAAQAGVYVYYLSTVTEQFGEIRKKGDITLIR